MPALAVLELEGAKKDSVSRQDVCYALTSKDNLFLCNFALGLSRMVSGDTPTSLDVSFVRFKVALVLSKADLEHLANSLKDSRSSTALSKAAMCVLHFSQMYGEIPSSTSTGTSSKAIILTAHLCSIPFSLNKLSAFLTLMHNLQ